MIKQTFSLTDILNTKQSGTPLVSIIVPVYNVASYINRCLKSLSAQTYNNVEIILVNDGSTDESGSICDSFAITHSNVKVIHKINGGLSDARNSGINSASGEYIYFFDSDDVIHPDTIKILVSLAQKYSADIVEHGYKKLYEKDVKQKWNLNESTTLEISQQPECLRNILLNTTYSVVAWNKLYRRTLFETIRFPFGKLYEDEFTTPYAVELAKTYVKTDLLRHTDVQRPQRIMHQSYTPKSLDAVEAQKLNMEYFSRRNDPYITEIVLYTCGTTCSRLLYIYKNSLTKADTKHLKKLKKDCFRRLGFPKHLPLTKRFAKLAQEICPNLFWAYCKKFSWFH